MTVGSFEHYVCYLVDIIDNADRADRVCSCDRTEKQRLGIHVADAADSCLTFHLVDYALEFGTERCVFYIMDLTLKPSFFVV